MKKLLLIIAFLSFAQVSFSNSSGLLFNVSLSGTTLTLSPKANHTYPDVGLLITNPNYSFSNPTTQCSDWPNTEGYCKFAASPTSPASISIDGPTGMLTFKLCLNFWGKLSCQNYTLAMLSQCTEAGGKIVSGSSSCWIKQVIPGVALRCSDVCNNVGLTLQQPGPTNSESLAGNVCAAYGYTDSPIQGGPLPPGLPITFISQFNSTGLTSCIWQNTSGTNWDNPNNISLAASGVTGNYICPCT